MRINKICLFRHIAVAIIDRLAAWMCCALNVLTSLFFSFLFLVVTSRFRLLAPYTDGILDVDTSKLKKMQGTQRSHRTAAIHTDSRITLVAITNPRSHQSSVESIRKEIRTFEVGEWIVHFTWVKAHDNNPGNELADLLVKEAA
jgi:hypothetical protein